MEIRGRSKREHKVSHLVLRLVLRGLRRWPLRGWGSRCRRRLKLPHWCRRLR